MSVFDKSFPVIFTTFINKCGAIGLSLIPMLLIARHVPEAEASLFMMVVKSAAIVGIIIGGWLCDHVGVRRCLLLSFVLVGVGLAPLPFTYSLVMLALLGMLSQLGNSMYGSAVRLLIVASVDAGEQKEAIGWQRMANNFGQIVSFSIGVVCSAYGITVLMLFNAFTSLVSAGIGRKIIPARTDCTAGGVMSRGSNRCPVTPSWLTFGVCALLMGGYSFLYDFFTVGAAGRCKLAFGEQQGISIFSQLMIVNTVLCAMFAVFASRTLRNPLVVFSVGLSLLALGASFILTGEPTRWRLFMGSFILTAGEIIFTSISGYVLLCVTPGGKHRGFIYSLALVIQNLGCIAGAGLAFRAAVYGNYALEVIWTSTVVLLILNFIGCRSFLKYMEAESSPVTTDS